MLEILDHIRDDIRQLDGRAVFALVYAAAGLTAINFLRDPAVLNWLLSGTSWVWVGHEALYPTDNNLYELLWWVLVNLTFYVAIPAAVVKFVQKRSLREIGLAPHIEPGFAKLLLVCVCIMLPLTYLMSLTHGFEAKYPFLKVWNGEYWSRALLIWELVYGLQFFGLEFFFRGFLVHSLKPSLGAYSILAMTVPYTMIHWQKPPAEAFAAIVAGIFLGWISYRNGTIWLGLILHCTVAFSMDLFALHNKGLIF
ncbi:MAG TPA: CPBP family intramembrane glutamic endopeptidase [Pyrinomonadaceae bacterium]|jgi:hypothetical protein